MKASAAEHVGYLGIYRDLGLISCHVLHLLRLLHFQQLLHLIHFYQSLQLHLKPAIPTSTAIAEIRMYPLLYIHKCYDS